MSLFELFIDHLFDVPLFEMAYERRKAIDVIRGVAPTLAIHLIKYYAFDDVSKGHWASEINGYLSRIDNTTLKPNNKKLSGETIYKLLWDEPLNNGIGFITKNITKLQAGDYGSVKRSDLSDQEIYEAIEKLIHTVSYDISNNKFVSFTQYV